MRKEYYKLDQLNQYLHRYGNIDDERAFDHISRLEDFERFRKAVIQYLD